MEPLLVVVVVVLVVGVAAGLFAARRPAPWDEIGADALRSDDAERARGRAPTAAEDAEDLRALLAEKRARRAARGGADPRAGRPQLPPWSHLDAEVVEEARALVARRRSRLERAGEQAPDEQAELTRLLGPPHP